MPATPDLPWPSTPRESTDAALPARTTSRRSDRAAAAARRRRARTAAIRRRRLFLGIGAVGVLVAAAVAFTGNGGPKLSPQRARIVALATGQLGYKTDPPDTYCNRFSAYWHAGATDCPNSERDEQWCADFAAWVWRQAGVRFVYGLGLDDLNASSASFYLWAVAHHTWHRVGSGYVPQPGDVAVYGLDLTRSAGSARGDRRRLLTRCTGPGCRERRRGEDWLQCRRVRHRPVQVRSHGKRRAARRLRLASSGAACPSPELNCRLADRALAAAARPLRGPACPSRRCRSRRARAAKLGNRPRTAAPRTGRTMGPRASGP